MNGKDKDAALVSFGGFTSDNNKKNQLRIPFYQRGCLQREDLYNGLVEDIIKLSENPEAGEHLIGTVIIYVPKAPDPRASVHMCDIVDGQQRIIALFVIPRSIVYFANRFLAGELTHNLKHLFDKERPEELLNVKLKTKPPTWTPRLSLFDPFDTAWFHQTFCQPPEEDWRIDYMLEQAMSESCDVLPNRMPYVNNFIAALSTLADKYGSEDVQGRLIEFSKGGDLKASLREFYMQMQHYKDVKQAERRHDPELKQDVSYSEMLGARAAHDGPAEQARWYSLEVAVPATGLPGMERLDSLLDCITERVEMIYFATSDAQKAMTHFNKLNQKQAQLTAPDTLKGTLFAHVSHVVQVAVGSIWNGAETLIRQIGDDGGGEEYDEDLMQSQPLTPYLNALLEITERKCQGNAHNAYEFRRSPKHKELPDEFLAEFCVEVRHDIPPAPPDDRLPIFKDGRPNQAAVEDFISIDLGGALPAAFASLRSLSDNSWHIGDKFLIDPQFNEVRPQVQNAISQMKFLAHLGLDREWIYPMLLAFRLWDLGGEKYAPPKVAPATVLLFTVNLKNLAFYMSLWAPQSRRVTVDDLVGKLPSKEIAKERRKGIYQDVKRDLQYKSPEDAAKLTGLMEFEKKRLLAVTDPNADTCKLFRKAYAAESDGKRVWSCPVQPSKAEQALEKRMLTAILLAADTELQLCTGSSHHDVVEFFQAISAGLRRRSSASFANHHRQLEVRPIIPRDRFQERFLECGWTHQQVLHLKNATSLGNFMLTLEDTANAPSCQDYAEIDASVRESPHLHGFQSTTRLLGQTFTPKDWKWRNAVLFSLARQSWGIQAEAEVAPLHAYLSQLPRSVQTLGIQEESGNILDQGGPGVYARPRYTGQEQDQMPVVVPAGFPVQQCERAPKRTRLDTHAPERSNRPGIFKGRVVKVKPYGNHGVFGFIACNDEDCPVKKQLYFNSMHIEYPGVAGQGDEVEFTISSNKMGPCAGLVRRLQSSASYGYAAWHGC